MKAYLALLRGINLGSTNKIAMPDLRELFTALGHGDVRTHLQTGNVIFTTDRSGRSLAADLQERIANDLGVRTTVLLRTASELAAVAGDNPLAGAAPDPSRLLVTFLDGKPDRDGVPKLDALKGDGEEFVVRGREVYLHCPNGYGRTKLSNTNLEKRLGVAATTRTWKVVTTLHEMMRSVG